MESVLVNNRPHYIMNDYDFEDLLRQQISDDAARYFIESVSGAEDDAIARFRSDPSRYCTGECDRVYNTQAHYENIMQEIEELARELYAMLQKSRCNAAALSKTADIIHTANNR